jgi:hypothetical protein
MKKIGIILIFIFTISFVKAQENKFSLGVIGSYDGHSLQTNQLFGNSQTYKISLAYSTGLNLHYNLNKKLHLKSGVFYAKNGYDVAYNNFIFRNPNDPAIPKGSVIKINTINVPLMIGFYMKSNGVIKLSSSLGGVTGIVINTSETSTFEDNSTSTAKSLSNSLPTLFLSVQLNIGIEYHLNEKIYIGLEPYFRYGFNTITDAFMEFNPSSYGSFLSLNYKFSKKEKDE